LWCVITSEKMQISRRARDKADNRTLGHLRDYYDQFMEEGGVIKRAKEFYDVISPAFFDIELTQVSHEDHTN